MGISVNGKLVVGIRVTRADFFIVTAHEQRCGRGHVSTSAFCPQCGDRTTTKTVETPTADAITFAASIGTTAERMWEEASDAKSFVHRVNAFDGSENDSPIYALGLQVARTPWYGGASDTEVISRSLGEIDQAGSRVVALWRAFGKELRPVEAFLSVYLS